jgi:rRNA-processing protein FCF1
MKVAEIKSEIQKLVEVQNDPDILNNVYEILEKAQKEAEVKAAMIARSLKAEEDIKEGRVYTMDEAIKKSDEHLKQHKWK